LKKFPRNTELRLQMASVLLKQGDLSGGTAILQDIQRQNFSNFSLQLKIGILLEKQQRFEEALAVYRRASFLEPNSLEARAGIGRVYLAREDYLGAIIAYEDLARLAPDNPDIYFNLARAYTGRGRKGEARETFAKARTLYEAKGDRTAIERVDQLVKQLES
jgi:Flp pilus assembly protein TadD